MLSIRSESPAPHIGKVAPRQRTATIFVPLLDKEVDIPPDTTWPVVTLSVGMPNSGGMLPVNPSLETDMQSRKKSTGLKLVFLMVAVPLLTVKTRFIETSSYYSSINIYNMIRKSTPCMGPPHIALLLLMCTIRSLCGRKDRRRNAQMILRHPAGCGKSSRQVLQ